MRDRPEQGQGDQGERGVVCVSREGVQPHKKIPQPLPTTALAGCITQGVRGEPLTHPQTGAAVAQLNHESVSTRRHVGSPKIWTMEREEIPRDNI